MRRDSATEGSHDDVETDAASEGEFSSHVNMKLLGDLVLFLCLAGPIPSEPGKGRHRPTGRVTILVKGAGCARLS
jgi:hypothetical protein